MGVGGAADPESGPGHRQVVLGGNGSDMYSGGARCEIRPAPRPSGYFRGFTQFL